MRVEADRRFFFVHVMKTGGGSFRRNMQANFADEDIYPSRHEPEPGLAYTRVERLLGLPAQRRIGLRAYAGHFPFAVTDMLDIGGEVLTTMTLLREPVERTLSHLRHRQHFHGDGASLEELYDDAYLRAMLFQDFQVKQFAMTPADRPESYLDVIPVDEARLRTAQANLARVDVIGLQNRMGDTLAEMATRFGWRTKPVHQRHGVERGAEAPASLRRRIAADSAADLEFYAFATDLVSRRARSTAGISTHE